MSVLYNGDCLTLLKSWPDVCVDLIYLDPPFATGRDWYDFDDRWDGDYISYMRERLVEMKRVLKSDGSIYYHCDVNANHSIKLMMDDIFGISQFQAEIVWKRSSAVGGRNSYGACVDYILYYAGRNAVFNTPYVQLSDEEMKKKFNKIDDDGRRFTTAALEVNRSMHGGLIYEFQGYTPELGWMMKRENLEKLDADNRIYWTKTGRPYRKNYADTYLGLQVNNVWLDIPIAPKRERTGYLTQKPLKLLERIISVSSNPGDLVVDPFAGSGTTLVAAKKLGRRCFGIDVNPDAIMIAEQRLKETNVV